MDAQKRISTERYSMIGERLIEINTTEDSFFKTKIHYLFSVAIDNKITLRGEKLMVNSRQLARTYGNQYTLETCSYETEQNCVTVSIDHQAKTVRFGPVESIMVKPYQFAGHGLMSYLMSTAIAWLKTRCPSYRVKRGKLGPGDAQEDNRERRHRFYEKHGFSLYYDTRSNGEKIAGYFEAESVDQLKVAINYDKVEELSLEDFTRRFIEAEDKVDSLNRQVEYIRNSLQRKADLWDAHKDRMTRLLIRLGSFTFIAVIVTAVYWDFVH